MQKLSGWIRFFNKETGARYLSLSMDGHYTEELVPTAELIAAERDLDPEVIGWKFEPALEEVMPSAH